MKNGYFLTKYRILPKVLRYLFFYWRERAAFQRSVFVRSTASNDVVATILAQACGVPVVDCWQ